MSQSEVILHWYPMSPFAQEIAWLLNYKNVDYKQVKISPIEPRPHRRPLDGGYRKTPILQIGNHVYCDTRRIIDELEKRFPEPSLYPRTKTGEDSKKVGKAIAVWFDSFLFSAIGRQFDVSSMPDEFKKDREQFIGQKFGGGSPFMRIDLIAQITQVQALLENKLYVLDTPTLSFVDLSLAKDTLFLINILGHDWVKANAITMLEHFRRITDEVKMSRTDNLPALKAQQALEIAQAQATPYTGLQQCHLSELKIGQVVAVEPLDTGRTPSIGVLRNLTQNEIVIEHKSETLTSIIYFPAVGFTVSPFPNPNL